MGLGAPNWYELASPVPGGTSSALGAVDHSHQHVEPVESFWIETGGWVAVYSNSATSPTGVAEITAPLAAPVTARSTPCTNGPALSAPGVGGNPSTLL